MKVPMKWLKEYVDIDRSAADYAERMIATGTAVEGVNKTGEQFDGVVVGYVISCEDHPNSDHLHLCMVDVGAEEPIQIVCGAPNVHAGMRVAAALDGAHLPGGVRIKKSKMRGEVSCGMLCSGTELDVPAGLYPHIGDEGIIEIFEEVAPGTDVKQVFGLGDEVVDFEILANRPDCLSVWGLARESAAVLDRHFILPEIAVEETGEGTFQDYASVQVLDNDACRRYCARVITNVKIGPSPAWMREYLYGAGVRPINNIVDITNFVMLETGQPMHAFDLSRVKDRTIVVRKAHNGEKLVTLDGKEHVLDGDMLVIADQENATGLAGIMGGEESEIVGDTASVLFESAAFERSNNRVTARRLGMRTEASGRFEKGVNPDGCLDALERACMLVNMLECGDVVPGVYDHYPNPVMPRTIDAEVDRICRRNGVQVSGEEMEEILNRLYIDTTLCEGVLTCVAPSFRQDIETEADIAEEVLRMYGYEHIPSTLMKAVTMPGFRSERMVFSDRVKNALVGMGVFEALNYSFISPRWMERLKLTADDARNQMVVIRNPLGEDTSVMRTSLVPSMLNVIAFNMNRGNGEGRLFELSRTFAPSEGLPTEKNALCIGFFGPESDFYAMKNTVVGLLQQFGVTAEISAEGDGYYHPGRKAVMRAEGKRLAVLGEIHPDVAERFGIEKRVYLAEVDLDALQPLEKPFHGVKPLPKFPAVTRDLALVVDEQVGAGTMMETIRKAAKHLDEVKLFDIYRGDKLGAGKKSVAYALSFRATDRTLTDQEIASSMEKILHALGQAHQAEIRA
ncbi:MAG: phenylalanine--tRNA ligase subunit beta [Christensenellales bacterium]|nr:phenylalanine--tRNA ligase subunit beta [Christensenellales bacterium]